MSYNPILHKPRLDKVKMPPAEPTTDNRLDAVCERLDRLIALLERGNLAAEWTARKTAQIRRQG